MLYSWCKPTIDCMSLSCGGTCCMSSLASGSRWLWTFAVVMRQAFAKFAISSWFVFHGLFLSKSHYILQTGNSFCKHYTKVMIIQHLWLAWQYYYTSVIYKQMKNTTNNSKGQTMYQRTIHNNGQITCKETITPRRAAQLVRFAKAVVSVRQYEGAKGQKIRCWINGDTLQIISKL